MSGLVWRASAAMWVLSLVMSSNGNVLPQLYFQRVAPAQKLTWLALSLLCATIASIAGVLASRSNSDRARRTQLALVVAFAAEAALPRAPGAIAFVLMASVAQFTVNYALNALDHAATDALGDARTTHDRVSTGARLLGMLVAPLIAPHLIDRGLALSALFVALGVATVGSARSVLRSAEGAARAVERASSSTGGALSDADRAVLGYASSVYVALYLIAANLLYLLRDVARVANAERVGGATLTVVFAGALLGAGLRAKVLSIAVDPPRVAHLVAPAPFLALVAGALSSGWRVPTAALFAGGLALGLAYGVFLAALREYVARPRVDATRGALLSAFNNLANGSSVVAFALLALASMLARGRAYTAMMTLAALLPFVGSAWLTRLRSARA